MANLSWQVEQLVYNELEKIHPHTEDDHGPYDLLAPALLLYPRMNGKSAAARKAQRRVK